MGHLKAVTLTALVVLALVGCGGGGGGGGTPVPVPTITSVSPDTGTTVGGTPVTITGTNFLALGAGPNVVIFDGMSALSVVTVNDTTITCLSPAHADGLISVVVQNLLGQATLTDCFTYESRFLYAADGKTGLAGNLYRIDPATGASTVIGPIGYAITGLALAADGTLYGSEATQSGNQGDASLIRINKTTGAGTPVGLLFDGSINHHSTADLTFVGDRLIGWTESGDDPIEIDEATGAVTVIGDSGVSSSGSGIAMAPDGTLYFLPGRVNGSLYTINPTTGVGFEGPALSGGTYDNFNSMCFLDGVCYAIDTQDLGSTGSLQVLVTINTTTGAITPIGPVPTPIDSLVGAMPVTAP